MNSTGTHTSATIRKSELAKLLDVVRSRISQLVAAGLPTLPDGRLHRQTALRWIAQNCSSGAGGWHLRRGRDLAMRAAELLAVARPKTPHALEQSASVTQPQTQELLLQNGIDMEGILATRQKRELLRIDRETFEFERARGKYVDRQEVEDAAFRRARDERDSLLAWPNRVASMLAADIGVDESKLHACLEKHIRAYLSERSEVGPLLEATRQ